MNEITAAPTVATENNVVGNLTTLAEGQVLLPRFALRS